MEGAESCERRIKRTILKLITINRKNWYGKNVRQKRVSGVGNVAAALALPISESFIENRVEGYSGMRDQNGRHLAL